MEASLLEPLAGIFAVIRDMEARFALVEPGDTYALYEEAHRAASAIAAVDAFYVCLHRGNFLHFVFNWDEGKYDEPATFAMKGGPTTNVIKTGKPYLLPDDRSVHEVGVRFGNTDRVSLSAIHVPLFAPGEMAPLGVLSAQSYARHAFSPAQQIALAWIADRLAHQMSAEAQRHSSRQRITDAESVAQSVADAGVQEILILSKGWQTLMEKHQAVLPSESQREARQLMREAERAQTRLSQTLAAPHVPNRKDDTVELTPQERAVLRGIVAEQTNKEIAAELFVTERAVKFHCTNLFRKLSVATRTQAARVGRRFAQEAGN